MTLAEKIAAIRNVALKRGLPEAEISDVITGWLDWESSLPLPKNVLASSPRGQALPLSPQLRDILTEAGILVWYEEQRHLGRLA